MGAQEWLAWQVGLTSWLNMALSHARALSHIVVDELVQYIGKCFACSLDWDMRLWCRGDVGWEALVGATEVRAMAWIGTGGWKCRGVVWGRCIRLQYTHRIACDHRVASAYA